jgi:hypothetical protein
MFDFPFNLPVLSRLGRRAAISVALFGLLQVTSNDALAAANISDRQSSNDAAQLAPSEFGGLEAKTPAADRKSLALTYLSGGSLSYGTSNTVNLRLDVKNRAVSASNRVVPTGPLRISLYAALNAPPLSGTDRLGFGFRGYLTFRSAEFAPIGIASTPSDHVLSASGTVTVPPAGTYRSVAVLEEFDVDGCPTVDRWCSKDVGVFNVDAVASGNGSTRLSTIDAQYISIAFPQLGACFDNYPYPLLGAFSISTPLSYRSAPAGGCAGLGYPTYAGVLDGLYGATAYGANATGANNLCTSGSLASRCNVGYAPIEVVEYYIPNSNKYFITGRTAEKAALDANPQLFRRTGATFVAFPASNAPAGYEPICRYYLPSSKGGPNTHFYGGPSDCRLVAAQNNPVFEYEGLDFSVVLPVGGVCPATAPKRVVRSFNNRVAVNDGNHRYSNTDARAAEMTTKGWINEGPVFCAPALRDGNE